VKPRFFRSQSALRAWFEKSHDKLSEQWIGFYSKESGKGGITYPEALDEALCFGWVDGVRKNFDEVSYTIRFTPRKRKSYWSLVNIHHAKRLQEAGRMTPAGLAVFETRDEEAAKRYSFEQKNVAFDQALEKTFRTNRKAWKFFESQPPGYRRVATWFVMSAKKEETRAKRLAQLIDLSARGERLPQVG
jgi:uncharacterized protein YdeI (YjbR/CyaY-like superfamily)